MEQEKAADKEEAEEMRKMLQQDSDFLKKLFDSEEDAETTSVSAEDTDSEDAKVKENDKESKSDKAV